MDTNSKRAEWRKFFIKIILPTILSILLFILTIFLIIIPHFKQNIMNGKREMIKELTNSALSILSKYENDERNGILLREDAQKTAISRIQYLRYGEENKDYFWITDMHPIMIMHPYRSDLNGKNLTNFRDPHGKRLFVEFVNTVKKSEHGYVYYMWQWKDDSLHIVPKLSYVKLFKPWGWVIGTGIYIEDVRKEINALTKKFVWISIGISMIISFLLLFISRQSLKIERKRIDAENELHKSKEKYRTLVEAATDGLIMLIQGKINFSNNVITRITGYENSELINFSLSDIISENNNKDIIETFSKNIVKKGQFELNLKKKNGGFVEVLVTASTDFFLDKIVNILIVKDLTIDSNIGSSNIDYQKLISTLNVGFFKARLHAKGRFIYANETALRILGYESIRELSEIHVLDMLTDSEDRKYLKKVLIEKGFIKNKILKIHRKNRETAYIAISLVLINREIPEDMICDGIIEDITLQESEKSQTNNIIAQLKANDFMIEQSVKSYISPLNVLDSESSINEAVQLMSKRKTDNILITKNEKNYIGIITSSDLQKRVLSHNLLPDNPVYLIMSSPVVYIFENTSVFDSIILSEEKNISHPVIRNASGEVIGILKMNDIYKQLKNSLIFFISDIEKAETTIEIKNSFKNLLLLMKPLINSGISVNNITNISSTFSDSVIRRIIDLAIKETGEPPVSFSFICMGSEGRKEETLLTDQDNAIIYEDVPREKEAYVNQYFNSLGEKVCNSLNQTGYSYCKGNIMAKNPQWCQPISVWEKYFMKWIATPEPQNLLDAIIFFDFRNVYGNEELTERLRKTVNASIKETPGFLYHLANNTYNTKPQQITSGNIVSEKGAEIIDLKNAVNPIIMFARTYSLHNNISFTNTIERLNALKQKNIISEETADEIAYAYNFLMKLRFRNQLELSESTLPLSNIMFVKNLMDIELSILKKVLTAIPTYQSKIGVDFRITI